MSLDIFQKGAPQRKGSVAEQVRQVFALAKLISFFF